MDKLIGTLPNQVPSNSDLGSSAFHSKGDFISSKNGKIQPVVTHLAKTANFVFVYDTTTDSDGGAWRKRCQTTSWYNEELNTETRGSKREFPSLAIIVAEAKRLTIYDADDASIPMWMVFTGDDDLNGISNLSNRDIVNAKIVNGMLVVGKGNVSSANILERIHFIKDEIDNIHAEGSGALNYQVYNGNISHRNSARGRRQISRAYQLLDGADSIIDLDVKALKCSEIDPQTKLPIPYIAVAMNGGVTIVRGKNHSKTIRSSEDAQCVDLTFTGGNAIQQIEFTQNDQIVFNVDFSYAAGGRYIHVFDVEPLQNNKSLGGYNANQGLQNYSTAHFAPTSFPAPHGNVPDTTYYHPRNFLSTGKDDLTFNCYPGYSYSWTGITKIANVTQSNGGVSMGAHIGNKYNTGWLPERIRLATACDTYTGNVTGLGNSSGILTKNWDFNNTSYWNLGTDWSISGGQALVADNGRTSDTFLTHTGILESRKSYSCTVTWNLSSGDFDLDFGGNKIFSIASTYGTSGTRTFTKQCGAGTNFRIVANQHAIGSFDNVEVYEAASDRSRSNTPVQYYGNLKRLPVANNADMTSISGFDSNSYMRQDYNQNFDFTGDFHVMTWLRTPDSSAFGEILHRGDGGNGTWGSGKILQIEFNSTNLAVFVSESAFATYDTVVIPHGQIGSNIWRHVVVTRRGHDLSIYLDGVRVDSAYSARDLTNTNALTWIGERPNMSRPFTGEISMFRMGESAPDEDQIRRIFQEESCLFQENAKCTLYGSASDPVNPETIWNMEYDQQTNTVHAGTNYGRSDFVNLQRVSNTSIANNGENSASGGTIIESIS